MRPSDGGRVNRRMKTKGKVRGPGEEHGAAPHWTVQRSDLPRVLLKGTAFLWNDSDSSCPRRQRGAVTGQVASVKQTKQANKN